MQPLAIDLFCGLGGWTEALLAEGYDVIGFDIERHEYGDHRYPGKLVIQDVRTLHGAQFKDAALIVASPPCQAYSYRAMPWKRAKALPPPDNTLFETCFRIQREANFANRCGPGGCCVACGGIGKTELVECDECNATGRKRYIPLIVENVRGAQKWVGRARWNFGSFYLWGDVPALMPITFKASKVPGFRFDGSGGSFQTASVDQTGVNPDGRKGAGPAWDPATKSGAYGMKRWTNPAEGSGLKCGGAWFGDDNPSAMRLHSSKSPKRKMASAMIAKIPQPLARHIAATFRAAPAHD